MKRLYSFTIGLLIVAAACQLQVSTPAPTAEILPTETPTKLPTVENLPTEASQRTATVKQVFVNVRDEPDGEPIGFLRSGDTVTVLRCLTIEPWCKIERPENAKWKLAYGWIYAGCLDIDSGRKCEAKE